VDDIGDDPFEVAVALAEVEAAEPRRTLAVVGVGLEHRPRTLTLCANHPSHSDEMCVSVCAAPMEEGECRNSGRIYSGRDTVLSLT